MKHQPIDNLKNIMVITALSNIPDLRQEYVQAKRTADFDSMESWWLYVVCSREYHKYKQNLHTAIGKFTFDDFNSIGWKWSYIFGVIYRIPEVVNNTAAGRNSTATLIYRYLRQLFFFQKLNNVVHYLQNNFLSTQSPVYLVFVIKRMFLVLADEEVWALQSAFQITYVFLGEDSLVLQITSSRMFCEFT